MVALGGLTGLAPFCLLTLGPYILGLGYLVPPDSAILSLILLPLGLGGALLGRQFFGIRRFLRRGLVALFVWVTLIALLSIALVGFGRGLAQAEALPALGFAPTILGIACTALVFGTLQRSIRWWLERALFHDVYHAAETLKEFSTEIVHLKNAEVIVPHILARLSGLLDLSWIVITVDAAPSGRRTYHWGGHPPDLDQPAQAPAGAERRSGRDVDTNAEGAAWRAPLVAEGSTIGSLAVGPKVHDVELSPEDNVLLTTLVPLIASALQNALLIQRLEDSVALLREREQALAALNAQMTRSVEEERHRIVLDLHDDPLQRAALLAREIAEAPERLPVRRWQQMVEDIVASLRAIVDGLRPSVLDDFGLPAGLDFLVNDIRARSNLTISLASVRVDSGAFGRLPRDLEVALYRVVQEALNNCLKHAAAARVWVELRRDSEVVSISVVDDGCGLDEAKSTGSRRLRLGILGMQERLRPWGGTVSVTNRAEGGTIVAARVPTGCGDGPA